MSERSAAETWGARIAVTGIVAVCYSVISGSYLSNLPSFDAGVEDPFGRPASSGLTYDAVFNQYYTKEELAGAVNLRVVVAAIGTAGVFGGWALTAFGSRKGRVRDALSVA